MIALSRKSLLALEAVLDVAIHARPDPVQARDITRRQGVPQRYLEQIMQALVRADILRGVRGPRGGYRLARERRRIFVRDIFEVISDLENADGVPMSTSFLGQRVVGPLCDRLQSRLLEELQDMTIDSLCRDLAPGQAAPANAAGETAGDSDFTI